MSDTTDNGIARQFSTGATRGTSDGKLDYEGALCPFVLELFVQYMHDNNVMGDGSIRTADNWQKGIPREQYMKSLQRHNHSAWKRLRSEKNITKEDLAFERAIKAMNKDLFGVMFNSMGLVHENLRLLGIL